MAMWAIIVILLVSCAFSQVISDRVPLNLCCNEGESYSTGLDECKNWNSTSQTTLPPIYSANNSRNSFEADPDRFELTRNLSSCPDGFISQSSTLFQFYDDGTLSVSVHGNFTPGNFCLTQSPSGNDSNVEESIARFCVPDPCKNANCLRKCCPEGEVLDLTHLMCRPRAGISPLNLTYHNKAGEMVERNSDLKLERTGIHCPNRVLSYQLDEFHILPDGRMYLLPTIPDPCKKPAYIRTYCIDYITEEDHMSLLALQCAPEAPTERNIAFKAYPYFLLFSSIFLVMTFMVYSLLPSLRNIHGVTIMNYVAAMSIFYIGIAAIMLVNSERVAREFCIGLAIVTHFAFLATFSWLNVVSFDIWMTFNFMKPKNVTRSRSRVQLGPQFLFYSIYGWGVPFIIVLIGQILDNVPNIPEDIIKPGFCYKACWFSADDSPALMTYLYGPIAVMILTNVILFLNTAALLYRATADSSIAGRNQARERFRIIFSLFILMGVTWMMEFISFVAKGPNASGWIVTDILNILTGLFVFVIFVCKPKVYRLLKQRLPCLGRVAEGIHRAVTRSNTLGQPNPYARSKDQSSDSQPSSNGSQSNPTYQRNLSLETTVGSYTRGASQEDASPPERLTPVQENVIAEVQCSALAIETTQ